MQLPTQMLSVVPGLVTLPVPARNEIHGAAKAPGHVEMAAIPTHGAGWRGVIQRATDAHGRLVSAGGGIVAGDEEVRIARAGEIRDACTGIEVRGAVEMTGEEHMAAGIQRDGVFFDRRGGIACIGNGEAPLVIAAVIIFDEEVVLLSALVNVATPAPASRS